MKTVSEIKVYSDVLNAGLILPHKRKYTLADAKNIIVESLFNGGKTLNMKEAKFVCRCSAVFHNTDRSKSLL